MNIKDLPGPGKLKMTGAGRFSDKLRALTSHGEGNVLDPTNQKAIVTVLKNRARDINIKEGLNPQQIRESRLKVKVIDPTITKADDRLVKKIFEHFGRGATEKDKKPKVEGGLIKTADGKSQLTPEQKARNTKITMARAGIPFKHHHPDISVMGKIGDTTTGTAVSGFARPGQPSATGLSRLIQSGQPAPGFANKINNASVSIVRGVEQKKPLNNIQSYNSLKGEKPVDLKI